MIIDGGTSAGSGTTGVVYVAPNTGNVVLSKAGLTTSVQGYFRAEQSASLVGSVQLGSTSRYTIGRLPQPATSGVTTVLIGQAGASGCAGGDMVRARCSVLSLLC